MRASGKACVAENDLPLPLAFSGLRSPKGWDWGVGIVNIPKLASDYILGDEDPVFGDVLEVKSMDLPKFSDEDPQLLAILL